MKSGVDVKEMLKVFLSDLIRNGEKRKKCLEMYEGFENTIKMVDFSDKLCDGKLKINE